MDMPCIRFKSGELVTGTNRSYQRSIYRYVDIAVVPKGYFRQHFGGCKPSKDDIVAPEGEVGAILEFVSFGGHTGSYPPIYIKIDLLHKEYRSATPEEIAAG